VRPHSRLLDVDVGEAVVAVEVVGHEGAGVALSVGALLAEAGDLAGGVVQEEGELHLAVLVLQLLGLGVRLLLALLGAVAEAEHQVQGRLLLDVVVGQGAPVLQLLAHEDQPLLVRRDALLVLDLRLHILDGVRRLHLQRDGLARQGHHEDLHLSRRRGTRWRLGFQWPH
jgi:hypothetical protein